MTDWIEHTTDTCPVDPETVVEVVLQFGASIKAPSPPKPARRFIWTEDGSITHYRIITPAKPPEPEMANPPNYLDTLSEEKRRAVLLSCPPKPEPDLITLRLECLKLAVALEVSEGCGVMNLEQVADRFLRYAIDGSVDKA
jgi:hypothetical protein